MFPFDFAGTLLGTNDNGKGPVVVGGVNISFPEEWNREYTSNNYHQMSVLTKENFTTYRPQYMVNSWRKHRQLKEIISLCLDFGIKGGYAHGAPPLAQGQKGSMFIFAGPDIKYDRRTIAILEHAVPHLHMALSRLIGIRSLVNDKIVLSEREKEILNWLKKGKTSWDVSAILGISQNTVNFHVYNVMRKLGACNRPQAVAVATHMGIILPG